MTTYTASSQHDDTEYNLEADSMKEAYEKLEEIVGEIDGDINDDIYSVAEGEYGYYTISKD